MLHKDGGTKERKQKTFEVLYISGTQYRRLIEKDGRPLNEKEAREEEAKMDREIRKRKGESDGDRRKRLGKEQKELDEDRKNRTEIPRAFEFTLLGEEVVSGRPCWKLQAEPRPGYKPNSRASSFMSKIHGTLWVDKQDYDWARIDAESLETFTVGLGLFKIGKGAHMQLEQHRVNDEIWAPKEARMKANAKALFLVGGNFDMQFRFYDYRKYSVDSTVTVAVEGEK